MNPRAILFGSALTGLALLSLLDAAAKGIVLFLIAFALTLAMRRASASSRHLVWLCAFCGAMTLPFCGTLLPQWRVLPGWMRWEEIPQRLARTAPAAFTPIAEMPARDFATDARVRIENADSIRQSGAPIASRNPFAKPLRMNAANVVAIWACGAALLLGPLLYSYGALWKIARRARVVTGGPLANACREIERELGIRRRVWLLLGAPDAMPMVWGIFRARLLLPSEAESWTAARLRAALLHELAHLCRRDPLSLLVAHIALALHWFNPLAWFAVRQLRIEQERAADDLVLRHGVRPSDYADDLLAVAKELRVIPIATTALSMAHPARLEGRIISILDAARNRRALTRWLAISAALVAIVIAVPLAMLRAADEKKIDAPKSAKDASGIGIPISGTLSENSIFPFKISSVATTSDTAEIAVGEKQGTLAFVVGEGEKARVIVHRFSNSAAPICFRAGADDRRGKWWDQVRVVRVGESDALFPMLPDDWLPNGRVVFLPTPVKRDDGGFVIAEIESASGKTPLAVRATKGNEEDKADYRELPRTSPDTTIAIEAWIYALKKDAPVKNTILPVKAAQDLVGPPRGALGCPTLSVNPGWQVSWGSGMARSEKMKVSANVTSEGIRVEGSITVPVLDGNHSSVTEAFRRNETDSGRETLLKQLSAAFSATLESNDALLIPIASEGLFPETLVSCLTALPRPVPRVRWQPPSTRSPVRFDGWVLTWPRAEHEWFTSLYDYKDGDPAKISFLLKQRKDTSVNYVTDEWVGFMGDAELKALLEKFRQHPGARVERIEPFSAPQHNPPIPNNENWTHFSAAGEPARIMVRTDGDSITPTCFWESPVLQHVRMAPSIGVKSGTSFSVLLPGPADPTEIRMMILRCVNPNAEPVASPPPAPPEKPKESAALKPSDDALGETKVPFQLVPVAITNWSAEQNGLRIGMHVVADEGWRIGGKVKVELWVHNPGAKDVSFVVKPSRENEGLFVVAKDSEGWEHFAERVSVIVIANPEPPIHGVLPAGYAAKMKDFTLSFAKPDDAFSIFDGPDGGKIKVNTGWMHPTFPQLEPGKYKLHCEWSDAKPALAASGEWVGRLTTSDMDFTLLAADAPTAKTLREMEKVDFAGDGLGFLGRNVSRE